MKTYFSLLDILRFFAAFWVMSFHYLLGLSGDLSWYRYGNLGVPLFFIISGFVISESLRGGDIKKFIIGRWIRLFPIFWILCTLTYIFTLIMPNGNPVSFLEYLSSMTMLGDKFGALLNLPRLVDPVYWSLTVELLFYIAVGSFVFLFGIKRLRYFFWGWLLVSMAAFYYNLDQLFVMKALLVRHASYFIFGGALALIIAHKNDTRLQKMTDYLLLGVTALYSTLISYRALPPYMTPHELDTMIVTLLHPFFFIAMIVALYFSRYITSSRTITYMGIIGGLTYPLYLIHQTVGMTLIDYLKTILEREHSIVLVMALMITVSYFFYVQDKKIRTYLRRKIGGEEK